MGLLCLSINQVTKDVIDNSPPYFTQPHKLTNYIEHVDSNLNVRIKILNFEVLLLKLITIHRNLSLFCRFKTDMKFSVLFLVQPHYGNNW